MILTLVVISQIALLVLLISGWIYSCDPTRVKRDYLWITTMSVSFVVCCGSMMGILFL